MPGPLAGLKIIEMAGLGPGPFAAMMLADHGAGVIRLERPGNLAVPNDPLTRSRRSLSLNLKGEEGIAIVRRLVRDADGLIEGYRPGVMERLRIGPDVLIEDNPNCAPDERAFKTSGTPRRVRQLELTSPTGVQGWWDVTGVAEGGGFCPAVADNVEDSSDGVAILVHGGPWGLRLKAPDNAGPWSLEDPEQWGVPFVVLDLSGSSIRFEGA